MEQGQYYCHNKTKTLKAKHIHIPEDSELLKFIYQQVDDNLVYNKLKFRIVFWSKLVLYLSLTIAFYSAFFNVENSLLFILCYILFGFSSILFGFNFAHDFAHGTIFRNSKLDNLAFIIIYAINGAHVEAWKENHIKSHHFAPNVAKHDTDLKISGLIRVNPNSKYNWYHRFQHVYALLVYSTYSLYWVFIKDFLVVLKNTMGFQRHLSFWTQKVFYFSYILLLPLLFSHQAWSIVFIGFLLMHLLQSLFLLLTFYMTHHVEGILYPMVNTDGYVNTSWVVNQVKSSNDFHPFSEFVNYILGGFNNHIAHHLFPHIHHIHYPKINMILYPILIKNGITPNQTSYWGGIRSHLRLLQKMGVENYINQNALALNLK